MTTLKSNNKVLWTNKQKHNFKLKSVSLELYKRAKNKKKDRDRIIFQKKVLWRYIFSNERIVAWLISEEFLHTYHLSFQSKTFFNNDFDKSFERLNIIWLPLTIYPIFFSYQSKLSKFTGGLWGHKVKIIQKEAGDDTYLRSACG